MIYDSSKGVRYEDKIENLRVYNSTWGKSVTALFESAGGFGTGFEAKNNLFVAVAKPAEASDSSNFTGVESDFKNAAVHDYHLASTAAVIDKGITLVEVTADRDNVSRLQGNGYDVGAYEFQKTSSYKSSDLNQDTKVDSLDFEILKLDYNKTTKPKSDINQDGIVNTQDIGIMMGEWG